MDEQDAMDAIEARPDEGWCLYIRTPTGNFCWPVGPPPLDDDVVNAARVLADFPTHDDWIDEGSGYDISHSPGDPHPRYLELHAPAIGAEADLRAVKPAALAEHADARAEWFRARQVEVLTAALVDLDEETLAAVLAHPAVADRLEATGGAP